MNADETEILYWFCEWLRWKEKKTFKTAELPNLIAGFAAYVAMAKEQGWGRAEP